MGFRPDRGPLDTRPSRDGKGLPSDSGYGWFSMGFELGPKLVRRAPKGWLRARAFPIRHSVYDNPHAESGSESVIDTSWTLDVLWRVEVEGRPPYELEEERSGPMWLQSGPLGHGNRWYKVRVGAHYGLMKDVGVPGFVDPSDPSKLWIDWDRAYDEHTEAWGREARVRRAVSERTENKFDSTLSRLNPFAGKLRPGEEQLVEERVAREQERAAAQRDASAALAMQQMAGGSGTPSPPGESAELMRRIEELRRISEVGRKTKATVLAREDTDRKFANVPVIMLTFEFHDGTAERQVVFEHVYGPRVAKKYKPGVKVDIWFDPSNPDAIVPN